MGKHTKEQNNQLKLVEKEHYSRWEHQSYMTGPEWRNVEMAEEYADFLREGNSILTFPYFAQIRDIWRVRRESFNAANRYNGRWNIMTATDYYLMDIIVPVFSTLEYFPKIIVSLLRFFTNEKNVDAQGNITDFQHYLASYFTRYAAKLHTLPFYDHPYDEERKNLKAFYNSCQNKTFIDRISYFLVSFDLFIRKWISKPFQSYSTDEEGVNINPATTDILVKYRVQGAPTEAEAKQKFHDELDFANAFESEEKRAVIADERQITTKHFEKNGASYTEVYARLHAPRYMAFQDTVDTLAEHDIHLRRSGSNQNVQVKVVIETQDVNDLAPLQEKLKRTVDWQVERNLQQPDDDSADALEKFEARKKSSSYLYSYTDRIHANRKVCLFDVPVKNLHETIDAIRKCGDKTKHESTTIKFIHNF